MHLKNHSLLVYPCLYGISPSDSGRVGGALLSQERVPMSRRSTVGTFCSSFYHFYFFKIDLETCKERKLQFTSTRGNSNRKKEEDHLHAIFLVLGHLGCFVVGKKKT
jgi:hypothetical protein